MLAPLTARNVMTRRYEQLKDTAGCDERKTCWQSSVRKTALNNPVIGFFLSRHLLHNRSPLYNADFFIVRRSDSKRRTGTIARFAEESYKHDLIMKSFCWPIRIYFEDTDSGGIVYYANYLKFMERARTEWLRYLGFQQDELLQNNGVMFIVRSAALEYYRPARFNDSIEVHSRITEIRRVSLLFEQNIVNPRIPNQYLCQGRIRVACVSAKTFKPEIIPEPMLMEIRSDS
jgi:acyl-CoA thioester hydrolase